MSFELDTAIAVIGFISFVTGVVLWLGFAAGLIVFGLVMMCVGVRMNTTIQTGEANPVNERQT